MWKQLTESPQRPHMVSSSLRETDLLVVVVAALPHVVDLALGHGVVTAGAAAVALPE